MLPVEKLPVDIKGLTPEMRAELTERIIEFEKEHEVEASRGGAGYVPKIRKKDFIFAGAINVVFIVYFVIAVLIL